ncbi:hypothetical protein BN1013_01597 [Candidatus Rubidus massiliensis]|nr:hypothetical protein BN1013_01597 [Candidatus Rubidus massiliensis]
MSTIVASTISGEQVTVPINSLIAFKSSDISMIREKVLQERVRLEMELIQKAQEEELKSKEELDKNITSKIVTICSLVLGFDTINEENLDKYSFLFVSKESYEELRNQIAQSLDLQYSSDIKIKLKSIDCFKYLVSVLQKHTGERRERIYTHINEFGNLSPVVCKDESQKAELIQLFKKNGFNIDYSTNVT